MIDLIAPILMRLFVFYYFGIFSIVFFSFKNSNIKIIELINGKSQIMSDNMSFSSNNLQMQLLYFYTVLSFYFLSNSRFSVICI